MADFPGALTALVTPFRDGKVDAKALAGLVEHQIGEGIDGLVPGGTTGEGATLERDEFEQVIRCVVAQAKKRVPVVAGAGTVSTARTIALARIAREAGADGLLLVCPYYNRPTQLGLEAHFRAVLDAVPLPSVLYNIPGRTGVDLLPDTLERLANIPAIVGIKEATGDVLRSQEICARFGDRYSVLSGDDALTLPVLSVGGGGVISVTSNVAPRAVSDVVKCFRGGNQERARVEQQKLLPLHRVMFVESNPGPVKAALHSMGLIEPEIRLPLVWPEPSSRERVLRVMRDTLGFEARR